MPIKINSIVSSTYNFYLRGCYAAPHQVFVVLEIIRDHTIVTHMVYHRDLHPFESTGNY